MELKRPSHSARSLSRSLTHLDQILCMARDRFQVLYCEKFPLSLTKVTVPNELGPVAAAAAIMAAKESDDDECK
jgi:hypothetical protein